MKGKDVMVVIIFTMLIIASVFVFLVIRTDSTAYNMETRIIETRNEISVQEYNMKRSLETLISSVGKYDVTVATKLTEIRHGTSEYTIYDVTTIIQSFAKQHPQITEDEAYQDYLPGFYLAESMAISCKAEEKRLTTLYKDFTLNNPFAGFFLELAHHKVLGDLID